MLQHVGVVIGSQQGIHGYRHQAGVHGTQKAHRPVAAVVHQYQHALFAANALRPQAGGDAAHAVFELAVGQAAVVVNEGGLGGAGGVFDSEHDIADRDAWQTIMRVAKDWERCALDM